MSTALSVHHGHFGRAALYLMNRDMATHAHREGHLVFLVSGAPAVVTVNGAPYPVTPGAGVAVSPWEPHTFEPSDPVDPALFLVLYIKPVWFLEESRSAQGALRFGRSAIEASPEISQLIRRLAALLLDNDPSDLLDGYLYDLTQACFDQSWRWPPEPTAAPPVCDGFNDFRVRKSMRLMRDRLADHIELDEVAREAGLSRPHFFKLFKKQMGVTPNVFLNTLKMEVAIGELTQSSKTVTEIGFHLGFSSQASFTRFFAANVGIPPSDYRRVAHCATP